MPLPGPIPAQVSSQDSKSPLFFISGGTEISVSVSHSVVTNSLQHYGLQPTRLLCLWDFPGKNTGVGCHFLRHGISQTQGSNPCLLHWQADSLPLSHLGSLCNLHIPGYFCHLGADMYVYMCVFVFIVISPLDIYAWSLFQVAT